MAVKRGPIRAMVTAHFLASKNRFLREVGRRGALRLVLVLVFVVGTLVVPLLVTLFGAGIWLGSVLPGPGAEAVLATLVFAASVGGGAMSGAVGGAKQLTWESYRTFPVSTSRIFAAEVFSGFFDLIPLMGALSVGATLTGIGFVHPKLVPWLALVEAEGILMLLFVQLVVGSLAERVVRRLRIALVVLGVAFFVALMLSSFARSTHVPGKEELLSPERLDAFLRSDSSYRRAIAGLPWTFAAASLSDALEGRFGWATARHLYPLGTVFVSGALARRMLDRDAEHAVSGDSSRARTWTFTTPRWGIAKLQWHAILESRLGRFGLVVPIIVFALVRGPLQELHGRTPWAVVGAYVYLSLVSAQFQLNQFGFDGHGVKTLLLLPIAPRDVFLGKALGLFAYQAVQATMMTALLGLVFRAHPDELAAGCLLYAAMAVLANGLGRRTSVRVPRMFPRKGLRGNAAPLALVVIGLGLSVAGAALSAGVFWLAHQFGDALLVPGAAAALLLTVVAHRALRGDADALLESGRETLLSALAGET